MRTLGLMLVVTMLSACAPSGQSSKANVRLQVSAPSSSFHASQIKASALQQNSVLGLNSDYCYVVHVTGDHPLLDKGPLHGNGCVSSVSPQKRGLFQGLLSRGASAELTIPAGPARRIDLLAFRKEPTLISTDDSLPSDCSGALEIKPNSAGQTTLYLNGVEKNVTPLLMATTTTNVTAGDNNITLALVNGTLGINYGCHDNSYCTGSALTAAPFAGGSGTAADPYRVCTATQFSKIDWPGNFHTGKYYILAQDISVSAGLGYDVVDCSTPDNCFNGYFDGLGNTITFNYATVGSSNVVGLFKRVSGGSISNLRVNSPSGVVNDGAAAVTGGLIGMNHGASVSNVHFFGTVENAGSDTTGGIVGQNNSGALSNVSFTGTIKGTNNVGGIIGVNGTTTAMSGLAFTGSIMPKSTHCAATGGLIGAQSSGTTTDFILSNSVVEGSVRCSTNSSASKVAGVLGFANMSKVIFNRVSFVGTSTGSSSIDGHDTGGGLVGLVYKNGNPSVSFAAVESSVVTTAAQPIIFPSNDVGGLIGASDVSIGANLSITRSKFVATVSADSNIGGMIGSTNSFSITDSYVSGSVTATASGASHIAGLVGAMSGSDGVFTNVFFDGALNYNGTYSSGLLFKKLVSGNSGSPIYTDTNAYHIMTCTSVDPCADQGAAIAPGNRGVQASYIGFDFSTVWILDGVLGRPRLRWEQ